MKTDNRDENNINTCGGETMLLDQRKKIYQKLRELKGVGEQINMLMEECGELVQAANKMKRYPSQKEIESKFAEEIGDVEIVIEQMKTYFPYLKDMIKLSRDVKMKRIEAVVLKSEELKITEDES